jgi:hypothetical protein
MSNSCSYAQPGEDRRIVVRRGAQDCPLCFQDAYYRDHAHKRRCDRRQVVRRKGTV